MPSPIIAALDAYGVGLPLRKPMHLASETIAIAQNLFVRVTADNGEIGWGEAASAPTMTGERLPGMVNAVRALMTRPLLGQAADNPWGVEDILDAVVPGWTGVKSAVAMAVHDLAARLSRQPLHASFGTRRLVHIPALFMLGSGDAEQDRAAARQAAGEGFRHFKLKVGQADPLRDAAALSAVRAAIGPEAELSADANMGWDVARSLAFLEACSGENLHYLEQPLPPTEYAGLLHLIQAGKGAIALDESIHGLSDIESGAALGVRWFGLKLIKLGGFRAMQRAVQRCTAQSAEPVLASKIAESSVSAAALAHFCASRPSIATGVSFTQAYLAQDLVRQTLPIREGMVTPPERPGHGMEVDEAVLARLRLL